MPSSARAGTFAGIAQGSESLARLLLNMGQQRKDEKRQARQDETQEELLGLRRGDTLARLLAGGFREGVSPDATGTVEVGGTPYSFVPRREPPPVPTVSVRSPGGRLETSVPLGQEDVLLPQFSTLDPAAPKPVEAPASDWKFDSTRGVFVNARTQEIRPATLPDGSPLPSTESATAAQAKPDQLKAGDFFTRASASHANLDEIGVPSGIERFAGGVPLVGNALGGGQNQRFEQAAREFVAAVLRRESGAAISDEEYARTASIFIPNPTDTPATRQQKAEARRRAIAGLRAQAGPAGQSDMVDPATVFGDSYAPRYPENPYR